MPKPSIHLPLLLLAGLLCMPLPLARAATVTDKPRLAILLPAGAESFGGRLRALLSATKRFDLVERPTLKGALSRVHIKLGDRWTVKQTERAFKIARADWVLDGTATRGNGNFRVVSRLYDLRTGEFSRELSLSGAVSDADMLAGELANFVRESAPLRCLVGDVQEDRVILDLGAMDGVRVGSLYKAYRYPQNLKPVFIGTVAITSADPLAAVGEVQDAVDGYTLRQGDALIEQTAGLLLTAP